MFLGSSCIYPRDCPQPIKETYLLTGPLEQTNEAFAIAKIAGIKLCESYNYQFGRQYISVMPTNIYGLNDNYEEQTSHVLPALIRRTHEAKERGDSQLTVWGTGSPRREFLFSDDLAEAFIFLMEKEYNGPLINIGTGEDVTIRELAETIMRAVGFEGNIAFDTEKPDGTTQKKLDVSRIQTMGWKSKVELDIGIELSYQDFLSSK